MATAEQTKARRVRTKLARARWHVRRGQTYGFIHVTVPKDEHEELKALAARRGETMSELIRTFIVWGTEACDGA